MRFPEFSRTTVIATAAALGVGVTGLAGVDVASAHSTVLLEVNGVSREVSGFPSTVSDVLASAGVDVASHDLVTPAVDAAVTDGETITVKSAKQYTVSVDGRMVQAWSTADSAADVLDDIEASGRGAILAADRSNVRAALPAALAGTKVTVKADGKDKAVEAGATDGATELLEKAGVKVSRIDRVAFAQGKDGSLTLKVTRVKRGTEVEETREKAPEERRDDDTLAKGEEQVVEEGSDKVVQTTYYRQTVDGKRVIDVKVGEKTLSELKPRVIAVGTKEPEPVAAAASSGSSDGGAPATYGTPVPAGDAQQIAFDMLGEFGFGEDQFGCLVNLWTKESGWNYQAYNPSSGAGGIPQALPASKMASAGADWQTNPATQIRWGLGYIAGRYGNPCGGWEHFLANNWY